MYHHDPCLQKPTVLDPIVHPTKCKVVHSKQEYIVPEVHPMHTKHVQEDVFKHVHSYPHSHDKVAKAHKEHFHCPPSMPKHHHPSMPTHRPSPW